MKEKSQDPLAARSTSRPIFCLCNGLQKSSSVLVVSTLVAFTYLFSLVPRPFFMRYTRIAHTPYARITHEKGPGYEASICCVFAVFLLPTDYVMMNCHCITHYDTL